WGNQSIVYSDDPQFNILFEISDPPKYPEFISDEDFKRRSDFKIQLQSEDGVKLYNLYSPNPSDGRLNRCHQLQCDVCEKMHFRTCSVCVLYHCVLFPSIIPSLYLIRPSFYIFQDSTWKEAKIEVGGAQRFLVILDRISDQQNAVITTESLWQAAR